MARKLQGKIASRRLTSVGCIASVKDNVLNSDTV